MVDADRWPWARCRLSAATTPATRSADANWSSAAARLIRSFRSACNRGPDYAQLVISSDEVAAQLMTEVRLFVDRIRYEDDVVRDTDQRLTEARQSAPLPSQAEMSEIVEPLFWASIQTEEQRPTRFRVVYSEGGTAQGVPVHRLVNPVQVDVDNVRNWSNWRTRTTVLRAFLCWSSSPSRPSPV